MTAEAAIGIYETIKSLWFAKRRVGKAVNGDPTSFAVAGAQIGKAVKNAATWNNAVGRTAKVCVDTLDAAAKSSTWTGYAAKTFNAATNYINPLITATGVIKVACAEDKKSEAINQGLALGTMFTAEGIAKKFLTSQGREVLEKSGIYKNSTVLQNICKYMNQIDKYSSAAGTSPWAKIGIHLLKAAAFVGVSVAGYSIGSKIAKKVNDARKEHALSKLQEQNQNPFAAAKTEPEEPVQEPEEVSEDKTEDKDSQSNPIDYSA